MAKAVLRRLRAMLILGRVSNLPTVWSNCLAGWWLGGDGNVSKLAWVVVGVSFLYLGGIFLNDAFDADFDQNNRRHRPIPAGAIARQAVWRWGGAWLLMGVALLFFNGPTSATLGLALALCLVAYNAIHRLVIVSPVLMGVSRLLVYAVSACAGANGTSGWSLWCGLALGAYATGLSFLAGGEDNRAAANRWAALLLGTPLVLALLINDGAYRFPALLRSSVLLVWALWCLRTVLWANSRLFGRTVPGLLAGIALVDWLAIMNIPAPYELSLAFPTLFISTIILQKLAATN